MRVINGGDAYLCTIQYVNLLFVLFQSVNDMAQRDCVIFDTIESCRSKRTHCEYTRFLQTNGFVGGLIYRFVAH